MSKVKICITIIIVVSIVLVLSFMGCKAEAAEETVEAAEETVEAAEETVEVAEEAAEEESMASAGAKVLFVQKLIGIPYCNRQELATQWASDDFGMNITYTGPNEPDATGQISIIEDWLAKGIDCLAVSSNNAEATAPIMKQAMEMGVKTIAWDVPGVVGSYDYQVDAIDPVEYGEALWDLLVEYMGDEGDYCIITGGLTAENLNQWIDIGLAHAEENYPNLNLVTERIPSEEQEQVAYQKALEVIKAYPNLKGIIGVSSPAAPGIGLAIQEKGLQDQITVVGTSLPTQNKPYILDGAVDAVILYDPAASTYPTAWIFKQWLDGIALVDGMDNYTGPVAIEAGLVGRDTLPLKDNVFTASSPFVFDISNVEQFDF